MLISGKVKSILTFKLVVVLHDCMCHCITLSYLGVIFLLAFPLKYFAEDPVQDEEFLVCWDGDRGRPGGRMIPCGDRADVDG